MILHYQERPSGVELLHVGHHLVESTAVYLKLTFQISYTTQFSLMNLLTIYQIILDWLKFLEYLNERSKDLNSTLEKIRKITDLGTFPGTAIRYCDNVWMNRLYLESSSSLEHNQKVSYQGQESILKLNIPSLTRKH